jgi:hypothetical protein
VGSVSQPGVLHDKPPASLQSSSGAGVGKNITANRKSGWPLRRKQMKIIRLKLVNANVLPKNFFYEFKILGKILLFIF